MRSFIFLLMLMGRICLVWGQSPQPEAGKDETPYAPGDTITVKQLLDSCEKYSFFFPDSGFAFAEKSLKIARAIKYGKGEVDALNFCGEALHFKGDYPEALKLEFEAHQLSIDIQYKTGEAESFGLVGIIYIELGEYRQALQYFLTSNRIYQQLPGRFEGCFVLSNIGDIYDGLGMRDSAMYFQRSAFEKFSDTAHIHLKAFILRHMGSIYAEFGKNDSALKFYNIAILNCNVSNDKLNRSMVENQMAELYSSLHQNDSSFYFARRSLADAQSIPSKLQVLHASTLLSRLFENANNKDSALRYLHMATTMRDSLYGPEKFRQLEVLMLEEQQKQEKILQDEERLKTKIKYFLLISALGIFLLLAFILLRNNRQKQKANNLLKEQKEKIETTLKELKTTQAQLIQREKMASLGELTAGIAHEIQNPLNFVNNFSEMNTELIAELRDERQKAGGQRDMSLENDILEDIAANSEKINHHGKRADSIVKGMLQHSRSSTSQVEAIDIQALADEYLRLSYHGMRAIDKSFNAIMKTDYDESIGSVSVIPQDIGRVLLNLYNNAFYAVSEKKKNLINHDEGNPYEPTVSIGTKKGEGQFYIIVDDNGNGIPQGIINKIFQPFFTTKPTGMGTGLGLSLSYDIIKAHGGEIRVESTEGEFTRFIISLPL